MHTAVIFVLSYDSTSTSGDQLIYDQRHVQIDRVVIWSRSNFHHTSLTEASELGTRCPSGQKWPVASVNRHLWSQKSSNLLRVSRPLALPTLLQLGRSPPECNDTAELMRGTDFVTFALLTISESSDLGTPNAPNLALTTGCDGQQRSAVRPGMIGCFSGEGASDVRRSEAATIFDS